MVGGYNGSFAILECTIEAFPLAVHYWERHDGRLIQSKKVRLKQVIFCRPDPIKKNCTVNLRYAGLEQS